MRMSPCKVTTWWTYRVLEQDRANLIRMGGKAAFVSTGALWVSELSVLPTKYLHPGARGRTTFFQQVPWKAWWNCEFNLFCNSSVLSIHFCLWFSASLALCLSDIKTILGKSQKPLHSLIALWSENLNPKPVILFFFKCYRAVRWSCSLHSLCHLPPQSARALLSPDILLFVTAGDISVVLSLGSRDFYEHNSPYNQNAILHGGARLA